MTKAFTFDEDDIDYLLWGLRLLMTKLTSSGDFGDNDAHLIPEVEALHDKIEKQKGETP